MGKLQEIEQLIDNCQLGQLFIYEEDGSTDFKLTDLGLFILKLEHIVQRDDKTIKNLFKNLSK